MARIIQDIQPRDPSEWRAVQQRVIEVHHATNIPRLVKSAKSFDIIAPGKMRGAHYQRNLRHELAAKPVKTIDHQTAAVPIVKPAKTKQPKVKTTHSGIGRRLLDFAQYPLIAAVAIGAAYSSAAGQAAIGLYALAALGFRLSSQYTFGGALVMLVSIPFFQIIHQSGVSQNAAIYAYELLVVGTLQAILELWLVNRRKRVFHKS